MNSEISGQLRLLALIRRYGTLAGAAEALGLTGPAVTQRVAKAEQDWGVALVDRSSRGASLAPAGAVLADFGDVIEDAVTQAEERFAEFRGTAVHRLRVGTIPAAALHLLPPALTALRHREPGADLSVVDVPSEQAIDLVAAGELDLAVFSTWNTPPMERPGVTVTHLLTDPLVLVLPDDHPVALSTTGPVRLRQLRDDAWVVIRAGHQARRQLDDAAEREGFTPRVRFETGAYDVAQALVGSGIGVALVSRLGLTQHEGTAHRALRSPRLSRDIHVAVRSDHRTSPLVDVLLHLLRDVTADVRATHR